MRVLLENNEESWAQELRTGMVPEGRASLMNCDSFVTMKSHTFSRIKSLLRNHLITAR